MASDTRAIVADVNLVAVMKLCRLCCCTATAVQFGYAAVRLK